MSKKSKVAEQTTQGLISTPYTPDTEYYPSHFPAQTGYWDQVDAFSIYDAALLMFGIDPTTFREYGESCRTVDDLIGSDEMPEGYSDRLALMKKAVACGSLKAAPLCKNNHNDIDYRKTLIKRADLITWCKTKDYGLPAIFSPVASNKKSSEKLPTNTRVKMLKIIIGMAIKKYDYKPDVERSKVTGENAGSIFADLQNLDISVDVDTIRRYLAEAKDLLPPRN